MRGILAFPTGRVTHAAATSPLHMLTRLATHWSLIALVPATAPAQTTVYAPVFAHVTYTVGAQNPTTGVFFKSGGETAWQHCGSPNVKAFDIDGLRTERGIELYLAAGDGLHRSPDGGATWKNTTDWRVADVLAVAVSRTRRGIVYIGTAQGMFLSRDTCATWIECNQGLGSTFISDVAFTISEDYLVCSTEDGVYITRPEAGAWERCGLEGRRVRTVVPHPSKRTVLAAGTEDDGAWISTDLGETWTKGLLPDSTRTIYAIAFDPETEGRVFAGGYDTGLLRSGDGGSRWERIADGLPGAIHSIAIDPTDRAHMIAATLGKGMHESLDGGRTWKQAGLETAQVWTVRWYAW